MAKYVTARDIVIPAGTEVQLAADRVARYTQHASVLAAVTRDTTSEWTMAIDDAIAAGLVEQADEALRPAGIGGGSSN